MSVPTSPEAGPPVATSDAGLADAAMVGDAAATPVDAAPPPDAPSAAPPDAACTATTTNAPISTVHEWSGKQPPKIDGDLSEWGCEDLHQLSASTAAYASDPASSVTADFAVAWDDKSLYVSAHVVDASEGVGGYDAIDPYKNSSVEIYASGDAMLQGDYDPQTHHYVIDYKNLAVDYGPQQSGGAPSMHPPHLATAVKSAAGDWTFEASIGWQALLGPNNNGFASNMNLALDLEVNTGNGVNQTAALVFALPATRPACACTQACCCGQPTDVPYCDSSQFPRVTLD